MRQSNGYGNVRNDDILGIPIGNSALKTKFLCFMYKSIYNNTKNKSLRKRKKVLGKKLGEVNVWQTKSLIKCKIIPKKWYVRTVGT